MSNIYSGPERRKTKRVNAEFIVTYKVDSPIEVHMWIGHKEIHAVMINLSEIGMAILTNYDIPTSTLLSIKFTLINLAADIDERVRSMEMTGQVRYNALAKTREHRLGIYFTKIIRADQDTIATFSNLITNQ